MTRLRFSSSLSLSALLVYACADDGPLPRGPLELDAGADAALASAPVVLPPDCTPLGDALPNKLSCTGLYGAAGTGSVDKAVHAANRDYAPGTALWTDGADKLRWIALPEGTQIDTAKPNAWVFPDRTRIWKEFAFKGKRAETRFMYKVDGLWLFRSYKWNDDDSDAVAFDQGGDVPLAGGGIHTIPPQDQCNGECHRGSPDKVLGFQQVLLGLPGAKGLPLSALVAEQRLSNPPARTNYVIPDDGTGMAAQVLSWIHVNCGVSCHNESSNARAQSSYMFLRIDPSQLDAASPADWNIIKLTVGVPSMTANYSGGLRIAPGSPDKSVLVRLAQTRGTNEAMPPVGTRIVDPAGIADLREWITRLGGHGSQPDAGGQVDGRVGVVGDAAGPDAGVLTVDAAVVDADRADAEVADAANVDAEVPDAEVPDAEVPDAEVPDAEVPDAEVPDAEVPDAELPPAVVEPPVAQPPAVVEPPVAQPPAVVEPAVVPV
jgi:hypothetical protein